MSKIITAIKAVPKTAWITAAAAIGSAVVAIVPNWSVQETVIVRDLGIVFTAATPFAASIEALVSAFKSFTLTKQVNLQIEASSAAGSAVSAEVAKIDFKSLLQDAEKELDLGADEATKIEKLVDEKVRAVIAGLFSGVNVPTGVASTRPVGTPSPAPSVIPIPQNTEVPQP